MYAPTRYNRDLHSNRSRIVRTAVYNGARTAASRVRVTRKHDGSDEGAEDRVLEEDACKGSEGRRLACRGRGEMLRAHGSQMRELKGGVCRP